MLIQVLKSKIKKIVVTGASVEYQGSLTLDADIMAAANIYPYEVVHVNAIEGYDRIITYVIPGKHGSGVCELNGGAANFFGVGESVHVNCFGMVEDDYNMGPVKPIVVNLDEQNKIHELRE